MKHPDLFANRTAVHITKHKKDEVIFPVLAQTGINLKLLYIIDSSVIGMVYLLQMALLYYKSKILK